MPRKLQLAILGRIAYFINGLKTRLRLVFYAFQKSRHNSPAWMTLSCTENYSVFLYFGISFQTLIPITTSAIKGFPCNQGLISRPHQLLQHRLSILYRRGTRGCFFIPEPTVRSAVPGVTRSEVTDFVLAEFKVIARDSKSDMS